MRGTIDAILKNTIKQGDCLIWTKQTDKDGYPKSRYVNKDGSIHWKPCRALLSRMGLNIKNKFIHHTCGNYLCLNHKHMKLLNSNKEIREKTIKNNRHAIGSMQAAAFLTEEQIKQMKQDRARGMTYKQLAEIYGYSSASTARQAIVKHWKHVK